jgi:hypothetical protein
MTFSGYNPVQIWLQEEVTAMRRLWMTVAGIAMLAGGIPVLAHHAFSAEFDANKPVKLTGAVTKVELINPHAWVHIEVKKPDGKTEKWAIEGGTPNTLQRRGITRDTIKIGTVIMVDGYQSKDGTLRANGRNMTFPDGKTLFMGSSGTGAPRDGKDPTEK